MWYYDYVHRVNVPLCSNPSCRHDSKSCFSYRPGHVYGYKDKLVVASHDWNDNVEFKDANEFVLELADIPAQTVREVLRLRKRSCCDTLAYGDKLFVGIEEEYYLDGDYMYATSDRSRVYLMVVSLETAEVEMLPDCLLDGFNTNLFLRGIENGKLIFGIRYHETRNESSSMVDSLDYEAEAIEKYMTYDIETKEIAEFTGRLADRYLDGCAVYLDGDTVTFDREGQISHLNMGYEFWSLPLAITFYNDGKVYFFAGGNDNMENMLYKFDTDTEKMYITSFPDIYNMRFIAERENEFILMPYDDDGKIVTLSKDSQLVFTELDRDRINALFEELFRAQKTPEELEEENREAMEEFQNYIDSLLENGSGILSPPV